MDLLQRLQPVDVLFAVVWACIFGWGLQSGVVRQLGMLLGVYAAAVIAGSLYHAAGAVLAYAFGDAERGLLDFLAYVAILLIGFCVVTLIIWRAYPLSRLRREFGIDNLLGATVAAVWGALLLIALLTVLRFYSVSELQASAAGQPQQRPAQVALQRQIQQCQVAPVLELATAPLWQALAPWFPSLVSARV